MAAQRAAQHDSTARGSENSRRASAICILSPEFRCFNNVIQINSAELHLNTSEVAVISVFTRSKRDGTTVYSEYTTCFG